MSKFIFVLTLISPLFSMAQTDASSAFDKLLFNNGKGQLPYRLLKPRDQAKKYPLVIFFHGAGERGNDNELNISHIAPLFTDPENQRKYPCYVLAPQCPKNTMWAAHERNGSQLKLKAHPSQVMSLVLELIEKVCNEFPIDESRIYITGVSMGGYATWELLARFPNRFAAAVPICGGGESSTAEKISHIPVWAFHGSLDNVVSPMMSKQMIQAIRSNGGSPRYTEYPDVGHLSWEPAYREPELLPWMFSCALQKKSASK